MLVVCLRSASACKSRCRRCWCCHAQTCNEEKRPARVVSARTTRRGPLASCAGRQSRPRARRVRSKMHGRTPHVPGGRVAHTSRPPSARTVASTHAEKAALHDRRAQRPLEGVWTEDVQRQAGARGSPRVWRAPPPVSRAEGGCHRRVAPSFCFHCRLGPRLLWGGRRSSRRGRRGCPSARARAPELPQAQRGARCCH